MRYPASEKLEIIRLVARSHLSARRTLQKLGIPRSTFNRWYDRFLAGGVDALEDRRRRPNRVWNRIPEETRDQIVEFGAERTGAVTMGTPRRNNGFAKMPATGMSVTVYLKGRSKAVCLICPHGLTLINGQQYHRTSPLRTGPFDAENHSLCACVDS
jgi:hypothetical protein